MGLLGEKKSLCLSLGSFVKKERKEHMNFKNAT